MNTRIFPTLIAAAGLAVLMTACSPAAGSPASTSEAGTPTLAAPRTLTICLGEEPESLYPYASLSLAAREVLAAVYDGPIDTNRYGYQPVILEKLPSLSDGDAMIESAPVYIGDAVVDAGGSPVRLAAGVRVRPAGCRQDACAIVYDGVGEILMDQMVVNFSLLPGLVWSDGVPLTMADSIYSYQLAAHPETPVTKYLVERTQSYELVDESTVQWWGKPGYLDATYFMNFWTPYPEHLWDGYSAASLPDSEAAARFPVGWGPFMIEEWLPGERIVLAKNPLYFRAGEGLPGVDALVYRFYPQPDAAVLALIEGECDLLAPSVGLDSYDIAFLMAGETGGLLELESTTTMALERLDFGIRPASYDDGFSLAAGDRPDFFSDRRVRQAIAFCLDRQKIVDQVLLGLAYVPDAFIPDGHPLYNPDVSAYSFDVDEANRLLEQTGWRDQDGDPATPRQAWRVPGVLDGTPLVLDYQVTGTNQRRQVSEIIADSLARCGIAVNITYLSPEQFYAPAPGGVLFGRRFDLAELAMGSLSIEPHCEWYATGEIPSAANFWMGSNITGYSSPAYDTACRSAGLLLSDEDGYAEAYQQAQAIFAEDLPGVPLFWQLKVAAFRPGLCNFALDPSASSDLWNIETIRFNGCGE